MIKKPKPTDREKPAKTAADSPSIAQAKKSEIWAGVTYQQRRRRNRLYWYAVWHDATSGKTKNRYIGAEFREIRENEF